MIFWILWTSVKYHNYEQLKTTIFGEIYAFLSDNKSVNITSKNKN